MTTADPSVSNVWSTTAIICGIYVTIAVLLAEDPLNIPLIPSIVYGLGFVLALVGLNSTDKRRGNRVFWVTLLVPPMAVVLSIFLHGTAAL